MINLKLSGRLEENVRIEKDNKIKIINFILTSIKEIIFISKIKK